jgi:hypothetical protein
MIYSVMCSSGSLSWPPKKRVQMAVKLLQVCRTWCKVALGTHELWKYPDVTFKDDFSITKSVIQTAFNHPLSPQINLKDIGMPHNKQNHALPKFISILNLNRFHSIESINAGLARASALEQLAEAAFGYSAGRLEELSVGSKKEPKNERSRDVGCLLKNFPTVECLTLSNLGEIYLGGSKEFESLHTLHLSSSPFPALPSQLSKFKNLVMLRIFREVKMGTMNDNIVMTNLVNLDMEDVSGFPWSKINALQLSQVAR